MILKAKEATTEIRSTARQRSTLPRLLLVTDSWPEDDTLEGLFLSKLLGIVDSDRLHVMLLSEIGGKSYPLETYSKHSAISPRAFHSLYMETVIAPEFAKRAAEQITARAKSVNADKIWFIIRGQTSAHCAAALAGQTEIPILTQLNEQPNKWLGQRNVRGFAARAVRREVDQAMQNSRVCAVTSETLQTEYIKKLGARAKLLQLGVAETLSKSPAGALNSGDTLTLGMFGYESQTLEMKSLLATLNAVGWRIRSKNVLLRIFGHNAFAQTTNPANIEYLGWRGEKEAIDELAKSDILFCANNLNKKGLPDKTHTAGLPYLLAAGRPIVYSGPLEAPTRILLSQYNAAAMSDSTEEINIDLYNCIDRLIFDTELYEQVAENTHRAFLENYSEKTMTENFERFVLEIA